MVKLPLEEVRMKTVMIVDDAPFMRITIKRILENNEFNIVAEAENGYKAIEMYMKFKPDIISLDITMPEMDGIEALKKIKEINSKVKVIMVTAMGQDNLVREAIKLGATSFLVKPFNENQLIQTFKQVSSRI